MDIPNAELTQMLLSVGVVLDEIVKYPLLWVAIMFTSLVITWSLIVVVARNITLAIVFVAKYILRSLLGLIVVASSYAIVYNNYVDVETHPDWLQPAGALVTLTVIWVAIAVLIYFSVKLFSKKSPEDGKVAEAVSTSA